MYSWIDTETYNYSCIHVFLFSCNGMNECMYIYVCMYVHMYE